MDSLENRVIINQKRFTNWLYITIGILSLLSIGSGVAKFALEGNTFLGFLKDFRLFNFDYENNVPTWYSSFQLLLAAFLAIPITAWKNQSKDKYRVHWTLLPIILGAMSLDETASIHERFVQPLQNSMKLGGLLHFSWVILGMLVVVVFIIFFIRFFLHLDRHTQILILISGLLYLSGVLGTELLGGLVVEKFGDSVPYTIITTLEEMLELVGIALLIHTFLGYIKKYLPQTLLEIK